MIVYAIVDNSSSPTDVLGQAIEVLLTREDAERFIGEPRGMSPSWRTVRFEGARARDELGAAGRVGDPPDDDDPEDQGRLTPASR